MRQNGSALAARGLVTKHALGWGAALSAYGIINVHNNFILGKLVHQQVLPPEMHNGYVAIFAFCTAVLGC